MGHRKEDEEEVGVPARQMRGTGVGMKKRVDNGATPATTTIYLESNAIMIRKANISGNSRKPACLAVRACRHECRGLDGMLPKDYSTPHCKLTPRLVFREIQVLSWIYNIFAVLC